MLKCSDIEKFIFENNFITVSAIVKIDSTMVRKDCFSITDLETYLRDLLTWDGLKVTPYTSILIKNINDDNSAVSDIMLPAIWFLNPQNIRWLTSYYTGFDVGEKLAKVVAVLTEYMENGETKEVE